MKNIEKGKVYKTKEYYCVPICVKSKTLDMFFFEIEEEKTIEEIIVNIENQALIRSVYHLGYQFKKDVDIEEFEKDALEIGNISKEAFDKLHDHWWTMVRAY